MKTIQRILSVMRHSNNVVVCIPTVVKKKIKKNTMLKPQAVLEKMHPSDTNIYASALIRVGFLGVCFEVGERVKLPPLLKTCYNYVRNLKFGT